MAQTLIGHKCQQCSKLLNDNSVTVKLGKVYVHEFKCFKAYWYWLKRLVPDIYEDEYADA